MVPRILPGLLVAPAACGPHLGLQQTKQFCRALWQMESQSLMDPNYQGPLPAAVYLLTLPPFTPAPRAPLASPASLWNSSSDDEYKTSPEDKCHTCWSWITPVITGLRKSLTVFTVVKTVLNLWLLSEEGEMQVRARSPLTPPGNNLDFVR